MKGGLVRFARIQLLALIVCFVFCTVVSNGQATRTLSSIGRRLDDFNRQNDKIARDEMNREMRGRKPNAEERRLAEARKAQIKEDFETLQTVYNDILTRLQAREALTDHYIAETTEMVSKSGSRLRNNIGFPVKKEGSPKPEDAPTPSMMVLCVQIHAFLTSPIFETGVLDIVEAEKARDTLDRVIRISASLRHHIGKID